MEIQELKRSFIEAQAEIDELIELLTTEWFNEDKFIRAFSKIKPYHLTNDTLMGVILYGLRLINNEEFYRNYSLEDINFIYDKIIEYDNKVSLELITDYSSFLHSTMDNNLKAKQLSEEGIKRARAYIEEYEQILKEINEEDN